MTYTKQLHKRHQPRIPGLATVRQTLSPFSSDLKLLLLVFFLMILTHLHQEATPQTLGTLRQGTDQFVAVNFKHAKSEDLLKKKTNQQMREWFFFHGKNFVGPILFIHSNCLQHFLKAKCYTYGKLNHRPLLIFFFICKNNYHIFFPTIFIIKMCMFKLDNVHKFSPW